MLSVVPLALLLMLSILPLVPSIEVLTLVSEFDTFFLIESKSDDVFSVFLPVSSSDFLTLSLIDFVDFLMSSFVSPIECPAPL